jgi:hypothetical protein
LVSVAEIIVATVTHVVAIGSLRAIAPRQAARALILPAPPIAIIGKFALAAPASVASVAVVAAAAISTVLVVSRISWLGIAGTIEIALVFPFVALRSTAAAIAAVIPILISVFKASAAVVVITLQLVIIVVSKP